MVLGIVAGCAADDDAAVSVSIERYAPPSGSPPELHAGTIATAKGPLEITYEIIDGKAVLEGDIIVPWTDFVAKGEAHSATVIRNAVWPNWVIPYEIDGALPDPTRVTTAVAHWNQRTGIRLFPRTNEADYVRFVDGGGCSSAVGRVGGQQQITLNAGCSAGNAIHEIGHAAGLWHEQSRADRDSFVTINWGNIQAGIARRRPQGRARREPRARWPARAVRGRPR